MSVLTVTVATVDRTDKVYAASIIHTNALGQRDTLGLTFRSDGTWSIACGAPITVSHSTGGAIFGGIVDRIAKRWVKGTAETAIECECCSWEVRCDKRLTGQRTYTNQTAGAIIADLITNCLNGESITGNNVATGPTIERLELDYASVTEALNTICELSSNGSTQYQWYIDPAQDLHFFASGGISAPFDIADATPPLADAALISNHDKYCNKATVRLGKYVRAEETEIVHGDGSSRSLEVSYPLSAAPAAIDINGTAKTFGVYGVDSGKQWYWNLDSSVLHQDDGETVLTVDDHLNVTYAGYESAIVAAQSNTAIDDRSGVEGGSGYYESVYEVAGPTAAGSGPELVTAILAKYAQISQSLEATVRTYGLKAGQTATVNLTRLDINTTMLIESVTMTCSGWDAVNEQSELRWNVKAVNGALIGDWKQALAGLSGAPVSGVSAGGSADAIVITIDDVPVTY